MAAGPKTDEGYVLTLANGAVIVLASDLVLAGHALPEGTRLRKVDGWWTREAPVEP